MSIFAKFNNTDHEQEQDVLSGFSPFDTDIYIAKVKNAYAGVSAKGAQFISFIFDINGKEYKEVLYITNQQGQNYYHPKDRNQNIDTTKKRSLPGFLMADHICLIGAERPLSEVETEEKVVNVYDPDHKKELPKKVPVITELLGKEVALGITNTLVFKQELNQATNTYTDTAESINRNQINKVYHPVTKQTVNEAMEQKEAQFWDKWVEQNKGKVFDKTANKKPSPAFAKSAQQPGQSARKSLFSK